MPMASASKSKASALRQGVTAWDNSVNTANINKAHATDSARQTQNAEAVSQKNKPVWISLSAQLNVRFSGTVMGISKSAQMTST